MEINRYEVLRKFRDLEDDNHVYEVGDNYPRRGTLDEKRVEVLASADNKIGEPLIKLIPAVKAKKTTAKTKAATKTVAKKAEADEDGAATN